jgi:two-component system invasion response regulator UvrY
MDCTMTEVDDSADAPSAAVGVLIVDDQAPFRSAAKAVIARVDGFRLLAEATSGEQAVELAQDLHPALVLMDINMGAMDGLEATRLITDALPGTLVVLVSTYGPDDLPPTARTCGAGAYLNKDELSPRAVRRLWEQGGDPAWSSLHGD